MDLRRAAPDDAPAMASIHVDAWRAAYRDIVPETFLAGLDPKDRSARFRAFLATEGHETYVVEEAGTVAGHLTIGPCRDEDLDPQITGEIWGIYLAPALWRRGIGRRVCRLAEERLRELGFQQVVLWVFAGNRRGRAFYEAMGFSTDGGAKAIDVGAPLPALRYRKSPPALTC